MFKKKFVVLVFVLTLFLSACNVLTGGGEPDDSAQHSGIFTSSEELTYSWGDINILGGDVTKTFTLTNSEANPLQLSGAATSCMCTTAEFKLKDGTKSGTFGMHGGSDWRHIVQPGESFDVEVTFDPMAHGPNGTGPIRRTVNVISRPNPDGEGVVYTPINVTGNVVSQENYMAQYPENDEGKQSDEMKSGGEDHHHDDLPAYEIRGKHVLEKIRADEDFMLVDVRESTELEESGVIEGAIHIPLGSLSMNAMSEAGISKDDEIVVYCRSGNRSRQAYELLNTLGFRNVKSMNGGIIHWLEDKRPLVPWEKKSDISPKVSSDTANKLSPQVYFDRTSEDFGLIGPTEVKTTTFTVSNTGNSTLEIGNITTSCSCTSAEIGSKSIEPSGSTTLTVTFDPNVHEEPKDKFKRTVFLETNDPNHPEAEVVIWVDIDESTSVQ